MYLCSIYSQKATIWGQFAEESFDLPFHFKYTSAVSGSLVDSPDAAKAVDDLGQIPAC
jgi:hypothetical protein